MADDKGTDLPSEPEQPGVVPSQRNPTPEEATALVRASTALEVSQFPMTEAIRGIAGGVRGQSGMVLLLASTKNLEAQLAELRQDERAAKTAADDWQAKYHEQREESLVLRERLRQLRQSRRVQQMITTLGGLVTGVAVPIWLTQGGQAPAAASILGGVLLVLGWFVGPASGGEP